MRSRTLSAIVIRLIAAVQLSLLAVVGPVAAQQQPAETSFRQIGQYVLELDGAQVPDARIYHSPAFGTILLRTDQLSTVVELVPRGRRLQTYAPDDFFDNSDGTVDKRSSAKALETGAFELTANLPSFTVEGRSARFIEKPPLLGRQTRDGLLEHDPTYGYRANAFTPAADFLGRLEKVEDEIEIRVFFGSWCSVCAEFVPHILAVEEALAGSKVRFTYHGLTKRFDDPAAKELNVSSVPTGIIFKNGKEVRRASGYSWRYPSMTIHNALMGIGPAGTVNQQPRE